MLFYIADGPNDRIQKILDVGICRQLSQFLMLSTEKIIVAPALRAVGNILTGDDIQTQVYCIFLGRLKISLTAGIKILIW